jgi:hypothetical protein
VEKKVGQVSPLFVRGFHTTEHRTGLSEAGLQRMSHFYLALALTLYRNGVESDDFL